MFVEGRKDVLHTETRESLFCQTWQDSGKGKVQNDQRREQLLPTRPGVGTHTYPVVGPVVNLLSFPPRGERTSRVG